MSRSAKLFVCCLALTSVLSACSSTSESGGVTGPGNSVSLPADEDISEDTSVEIAQSDNCADALAAFSAVSNMLMSGLSRPSTFEFDTYQMHLDTAVTAATVPSASVVQDDFKVFEVGYRSAGEAVEESRKAGGTGTVRGANAMDKAAATLNDVAVTTAAENVAEFFANGC